MVTYGGELLNLQIWRDHLAWFELIIAVCLPQDNLNVCVM